MATASTGMQKKRSTTPTRRGRKKLTPSRMWNDDNLRARLDVTSGKGGRIIIARVGSRNTGLVEDAALVFVGPKASGDYHREMNLQECLQWLEDSALPKIKGAVLVVDRAPYHMVLTDDTRLATSKMRNAELADWLEAHGAVPEAWQEEDWRQARTRAEMKGEADSERPAPRFLVQDLAFCFGVTILVSPVAHPELNPIEMVWGTVKMALRRACIDVSLAHLQEHAQIECQRGTAEIWARYEDHAIKMEDLYRSGSEAETEADDELDEGEMEVRVARREPHREP